MTKPPQKPSRQQRFPHGVEDPARLLKLRVEDIDPEGEKVAVDLPAKSVGEILADQPGELVWRENGAGHIAVDVNPEAGLIRIKGDAALAVIHPCVRCLEDVPFQVSLDLDLRAAPSPFENGQGESAGENPDPFGLAQPQSGAVDEIETDLDLASYQDGVLDLGKILREQLFLELPAHPKCSMADLAEARECVYQEAAAPEDQEDWVDPRLAGLKALRDKLPPGPSGGEKDPSPAISGVDKSETIE
jgi:uncharacterized metal-binding protein YceD (DUF177 family)